MTGRRITSSRLAGERGAALFAAVLALVLLSTLIAAMVVIGRNEVGIAQLGKNEVQAAYAAEAGANYGRWMLKQRLGTDLPRQVSATGRSAMKTALSGTYNTAAGGAQFLVDYAIPASTGPTFVKCSTYTGGCTEPNFSSVGSIADTQQVIMVLTGTNPAYTTRLIVGVHPTIPPVITDGGNAARFTYVWRIESSGTAGSALQQYVIHDSAVPTNTVGSFTIALNAAFVQYAHFIDDQDSSAAYISFRHVYTGPVHTNTRFKLQGNAPTAGQEGPTFRSEATQWDHQIRFYNAGSALLSAKDSSPTDWPILGDSPGIFCKTADCSGLTRDYDYDPTTTAIDKIPFPGAGGADQIAEKNWALQYSYATNTTLQSMNSTCTTAAQAVVVANNCTKQASGTSVGTLNGGIYVTGNVYDLQLGAVTNNCGTINGNSIATPALTATTCNGQQIKIFTGGSAVRVTMITENWSATPKTTRVLRLCQKATAGASTCNGSGANSYYLDPTTPNPGGTCPCLNDQTFTGVLSPDASTDYGVMYVTGTIGAAGGQTGLRKDPSTAATFNRAISANTRLTVAADSNIFITGHLNYQTDPRGADGIFSAPIPGDSSGTSADDNLDVQNVLGVVAWTGGIHMSSWLSGSNLDGTLPSGDTQRDGDLRMQGMFMAVTNGGNTGDGQISFDDYTGTYRGDDLILGGVVQKTMGTLGQPGSPGNGYSRNWTYDERLRYRALSPPAFPGFPNFTASTSLGIDSFSWRQGLF